jgi:hypothetical protein
MHQPRSGAEGAMPIEAPRAVSFMIELEDDDLVVRMKFEDGRERAIRVDADTGLFLREYLGSALANTPSYGPRRAAHGD